MKLVVVGNERDHLKHWIGVSQRGEIAVRGAMAEVEDELKTAWRKDITAAGLGKKLAYTVRGATYPARGGSFDAAASIWSKAPAIIAAHEEGTLIVSSSGRWLAIPLPSAGKVRSGRGGKRPSPKEWEQKTGVRLRFVARPGKPPLLVADDARLDKRGRAGRKGGRRRKSDGILSGAQTVPIFVLMPQVKLKKRTSLTKLAERVAETIPGRIAARWKG
ncbi:DUF6441 family protein [Albibacillus kandeliae]|uniref:DUF6441 family protein n=1 Tax=Albibacillus kandeliae TaxID=2174228 RepID=UPI000D69B8E5|nr:DUF6441 family protein [Albibacillus kandeliae]